MIRFLLPLGIFAVLMIFLVVGLGLNPTVVPSPLIGKPTPNFSLPSLAAPERILTQNDLQGNVTLLNVWATWCVACRAEHEFLMQLASAGDIPIYGVNYKDERAAAINWLDQLGDPYVDSVYDPQGKLALDLGVYGAPETFLLDANGMIVYKHIGPLTSEIWQEKLLPVIQRLRGART